MSRQSGGRDHRSASDESRTVAVVSESPGSTTIESALAERCTVRPVDCETVETIEGDQQVDGIVLAIDRPDRLRHCLEQLSAVTVPTIVVPTEGSESLAAAAVAGGADDYLSSDEDPLERILERIDREPTAARRSAVCDRILAQELPDEAFVIAADGTYLEAKLRPSAAELYNQSETDLIGNGLQTVFPAALADRLLECVQRAITTEDTQSIEYDAETAAGTRHYEARVVPTTERIDGQRAVVWLARDITERAEREQQLQARQSELETVTRINAAISDTIETLLDTQDPAAIERVVCEQLVDSELYCGAYVAEKTPADRFSYRTGAGSAETFLTAVEHHLDTMDVLHDVIGGETVVANRVLETEPLPEPLQAAAHEDELRAGIAVPVVHEGVTYGLLVALSQRTDAFGEAEQEAFELLGRTIGFTIMAIKNQQLLFADSVVELEVAVSDESAFAFALSERHECQCSLEWTGRTAEGEIYQYLSVDGASSKDVGTAAEAHDDVTDYRLLKRGDDCCKVELALTQPRPLAVTNHGATLRTLTIEDGGGTATVEVPQDADVREIVRTLEAAYDEVSLVARRTVDRPVQTAAERSQRIGERLTERQLTTVRLAYYGGYFEWPRNSTGEEIADAMEVSAPTMHQHLRKGLDTILREFFDD